MRPRELDFLENERGDEVECYCCLEFAPDEEGHGRLGTKRLGAAMARRNHRGRCARTAMSGLQRKCLGRQTHSACVPMAELLVCRYGAVGEERKV